MGDENEGDGEEDGGEGEEEGGSDEGSDEPRFVSTPALELCDGLGRSGEVYRS